MIQLSSYLFMLYEKGTYSKQMLFQKSRKYLREDMLGFQM